MAQVIIVATHVWLPVAHAGHWVDEWIRYIHASGATVSPHWERQPNHRSTGVGVRSATTASTKLDLIFSGWNGLDPVENLKADRPFGTRNERWFATAQGGDLPPIPF